jgi:hypothetical protein
MFLSISIHCWLLLWGSIVQSVPCNYNHFLIYCALHLSYISNSLTTVLCSGYSRETCQQSGEKLGEKCLWILPISISIIPQGSLTCHKILRHRADGFTSPLKQAVLQNFITLKNTSCSARFEPTNLGSNVNHNNHYTTKNDISIHTLPSHFPSILLSLPHGYFLRCTISHQNCKCSSCLLDITTTNDQYK